MARFNLGARMEEVEQSMCAGEDCNIVNPARMNTPLRDRDVVFFENEDMQESESDKNEK